MVSSIEHGMVALVGYSYWSIRWLKMVDKVIHLRIFDDEAGIMNRSLLDTNGQIADISQFTLYADTKKGRPSYINGFEWKCGCQIIWYLESKLKKKKRTKSQQVSLALMKVSLVNDGPVTVTVEK